MSYIKYYSHTVSIFMASSFYINVTDHSYIEMKDCEVYSFFLQIWKHSLQNH